MYDTNEEYIKEAINGSNEAMENIINNNQGLVWNIVARFSGRGYEKEELYQIGAIGLIKAVKRFDFSFGVKFSTYAVPYIMGEIKRFIRDITIAIFPESPDKKKLTSRRTPSNIARYFIFTGIKKKSISWKSGAIAANAINSDRVRNVLLVYPVIKPPIIVPITPQK